MILAAQKDIDVVAEAGDGREALEKAGELEPDVFLMDIRMPSSSSGALHPARLSLPSSPS